VTNTANVQRQLDQAKEKADLITNKKDDPLVRLSLLRPTSSVEQFMYNTKSYYKGRLVPSGKNIMIFVCVCMCACCITLVIFNSKRVLERSSDVCYFKYYSI
jgi:hypothetical protein